MNRIVLISFWKISFKYDKYVENWIFCIDVPVFKIITVFTCSDVEAILFASDASFWYWNAKHAYNLKGSYKICMHLFNWRLKPFTYVNLFNFEKLVESLCFKRKRSDYFNSIK